MAKKVAARYKQMAFETAVRNPERYKGILTALVPFANQILNDDKLLEIVSTFYLNDVVSSGGISIKANSTLKNIGNDVIFVNRTRKADGGFPAGYASRFWTYVRTLSELGFVYARYEKPLRLSPMAMLLVENRIDEQEAFSIQAMKYNRKSPYRNVSNDFNFFRFILKVLIQLKKLGKALSYEQFIVATFSNDGDVKEFLEIIEQNKFKDDESAYNFIKKKYKTNSRIKTVTKDYPDVIRRLFIISGFITIRYSSKKFIEINENKLEYIKEILKTTFKLTNEEKLDAQLYFNKLGSSDAELLDIANKFRVSDKISGEVYASKVFDIIKEYKIDEKIIIESIKRLNEDKRAVIPEFQEIPAPLKLEFYISILVALKYGNVYAIRPNYKADHIGKPYSHAPGNAGDIEVYSKKIYWLIEVTLIRNKAQQYNHETTSVIRHLISNEEFADRLNKYLSFIAPVIHDDTKEFYNFSAVQNSKKAISIKPYTIEEFVETTISKNNFADMEQYTSDVIQNFKANFN